MASNLPPGCTESMIPGNRPEDMAWEAAEEWAMDYLNDAKLSIEEYRRAILVGVAAIIAEREAIDEYVENRIADDCLGREMERGE